MKSIDVGRATRADAGGIAWVQEHAWMFTYDLDISADELRTAGSILDAAAWGRIIDDGETDVIVARNFEGVVGWCTVVSDVDTRAPTPLLLQGLYLLDHLYGTGVGQRLLDAAIGHEAAYLWIMAGNPRAESFYARNRFSRDGAFKERRVAGRDIRVYRMVRPPMHA